MSKTAVHEHRRQEGEPNRNRTWCLRYLDGAMSFDGHRLGFHNIDAGGDLLRDHTPSVSELGIADLHEKKDHVGRKQGVGDEWNDLDIAIVIADGK